MVGITEVDQNGVDGAPTGETTAGGEGGGGGRSSHDDDAIMRGRVVVKEIGERTRKGGYHLTLIRYKQYALFRKISKTVET